LQGLVCYACTLAVAKMRARLSRRRAFERQGNVSWLRAVSEKPSHVFGEAGRHIKGSSIRQPNVQASKPAYRNFIFTSPPLYFFFNQNL
jgi:hypothetical protein